MAIADVKMLILLVGSNPFPNYIAAMALKPEKVLLLCTEETEKIAVRLEKVLTKRFVDRGIKFEKSIFSDATDPHKIVNHLNTLKKELSQEGVHLHYTGGTKAMAAQCLQFFYSFGPGANNASYLDDKDGYLRFDSGFEVSLEKLQIKIELDEILEIHGLTKKNKAAPIIGNSGKPWLNDLARLCFVNPNLPHLLYEQCKEYKKLGDKNIDLSFEHIECLKSLGIPLQIKMADKNGDQRNDTLKFWKGEWLELWLSHLLYEKYGEQFDSIYQSIFCRQDGSTYETEIDICLIKNYKFYAISVTTDSKFNDLCKSKLFEITIRGRQLGGDHARTALCCFVDGIHQKNRKTDILRDCMKSSFNAQDEVHVFGLSDLRAWAGVDESGDSVDRDFSKLESYLEIGE